MTIKLATIAVLLLALHSATASQTPSPDRAANQGSLRQIIPDHYVFTQNTEGRLFNSGVVATSEGVVVFDALDSEAIARAQRQAIAGVTKQPVRYLVSSVFHDPFSKGNIAYADAFKIGHETYRAGLLDQMQRGKYRTRSSAHGCPTRRFAIE